MSDTIKGRGEPSGRFVLRLPPAFHKSLKRMAKAAGISLNDLCLKLLSGNAAHAYALAGVVVERAILESGEHLVGVVIFGSYARGTHHAASDLDVLFVVDQDVTRSLYSSWDAEPLRFDGHPIEPHFVKMPSRENPITSLWAEVATEGAVIYDPSLEVARYLTHVRHAIVGGVLIRRVAQGKPYWTAA